MNESAKNEEIRQYEMVLRYHKTTELRKAARSTGIKEVGGRPVYSGRKEDLIAALVAIKVEYLKGSGKPATPKTSADRKIAAQTEKEEIAKTNGRRGNGLPSTRKTASALAPKAPAGSPVHAKALRFEADAKAAGWTALARNGSAEGVSLVTARRGGEEIAIVWENGVFQYERTSYKAKDGAKEIRVRNASAARKLLEG